MIIPLGLHGGVLWRVQRGKQCKEEHDRGPFYMRREEEYKEAHRGNCGVKMKPATISSVK